ncbi:LOW QUALITY PROTEIN: hypothetical protein U9M48_038084 [Paspalum notatum var. saurae]|uniref:MORF/ORRM1/DAG-like MORF domain-containing protein n=1 Tax=Paspalum notatum var. saurae TaxID=547442 RepID=A0AAQ3UG91_PASNO
MATASRALLLSRAALSPLQASATSRRLPALLRPLAAAASLLPPVAAAPSPGAGVRCFATQPATSSLRDSSPNWSNRPPKETILLDGCDFEHWLVVMEPPPGDAGNPDVTRDEIIDSYIKTLAQVVGSEEEARQKIYSVSTRHYFAFGALVSEELSYKLKELPKVRWVLPDSYLDVKNKDYGGEPFINGVAVPYDPKYHEEWVRNNARANIKSRGWKNNRRDVPRKDSMLLHLHLAKTRCHPVKACTMGRETCIHHNRHMQVADHLTTSHKCQTHKQVTPLVMHVTTSKADLQVDIRAITKVTKAQLIEVTKETNTKAITRAMTKVTNKAKLIEAHRLPTNKEATPTHHRTNEATILAMVVALAVPYDPKYHEEWVRNNARANERSRRNDRPKNFDRSRNFERRRENMQNFQNQMPPRQGMQHGQSNMPPPPQPPHAGGAPPNYQPQMPRQTQVTKADLPVDIKAITKGYQGPAYQGGGNPGYQVPPPSYQGGSPNAPP